jgi:hypothetical protein
MVKVQEQILRYFDVLLQVIKQVSFKHEARLINLRQWNVPLPRLIGFGKALTLK